MTEPEYYKVRENPDLVRQVSSSAILNTNDKELNKYRQERETRLKLLRVVEDTENLKNDVSEIKSMLKQLLGQK